MCEIVMGGIEPHIYMYMAYVLLLSCLPRFFGVIQFSFIRCVYIQ